MDQISLLSTKEGRGEEIVILITNCNTRTHKLLLLLQQEIIVDESDIFDLVFFFRAELGRCLESKIGLRVDCVCVWACESR